MDTKHSSVVHIGHIQTHCVVHGVKVCLRHPVWQGVVWDRSVYVQALV